MILNINSFVKLKLTPRGQELYLFYFGEHAPLDEEGYYRCQISRMFLIFGNEIDYGKELLYEPEIIYEG